MTEPPRYSIVTKEGWARFVNAEPFTKPARLTPKKLAALSSRDKARYDHERQLWHANTGTLQTPTLTKAVEQLWEVLRTNVTIDPGPLDAAAVEGDSFLGKTTIVRHFAKKYHQEQVDLKGPMTDAGDERHPVAYITLSGNPTVRDLNASILYFLAHPGAVRGSASDIERRALDSYLKCDVTLLIVDDLHFLRWQSADGSKVSNHLKAIVNNFPITLIVVGTALTELGILSPHRGLGKAVLGPTARRTTSFKLEPYPIKDRQDRKDWRSTVHAIERTLVLARHQQGTLTHELSDYLYERSTGYMGSLMTLIRRGATRAIRSGTEALTEDLLEAITIDVAAEAARKATAAQLHNLALNRWRPSSRTTLVRP